MPASCIFHVPGEECLILVHHRRDRKTGPRFALTVATCAVHGCAFTLYPCGHVPYGRHAIAPVSPSGEPIKPETKKKGAWRGTVFDAALDAAEGVPWPREPTRDEEMWSSQGRNLSFALSLTGVDPEMDDGLRHRVADALSVPMLTMLAGAARIRRGPGYEARGVAISSVLAEIPLADVLRRVLVAGHVAGLWGPPRWWDAHLQILRPLVPFQSSGTDPP